MDNVNGYTIHEGTVNGHAFFVVATLKSSNDKTGNMVQTWFLLRDIKPTEAVKSGLDASTICRECPLASGNGCYVTVFQAPLNVWKTWHRGKYPELAPKDYHKVFGGRSIRFGAYGNPSLLPISKVKAIAAVSKGWTGYFHDWKSMARAKRQAYGKYFMASTDDQCTLDMADGYGLRSFHVSFDQPENTIECLSDSKNLTCEKCKLCAGTYKKNKKSVWINPHGAKVNRIKERVLVS